MKRKPSVPVLALCLALLILLTAGTAVHARMGFHRAPADAGFFSGGDDYDYDPGDWSSSGDSWSSDDSWSSGDSWSSSSSSSSGSGSPIFSVIVLIIIVILVIRSKRGGKKGSKTGSGGVYRPTGTTRTISPQQSAAVANQIRVHDPFFTEAEMREKVANLYVNMQSCWERQDWEPMRAHLTDDLFSQMGRQLNELVTRGQINKMERIAVMDVSLMSFHQDEQFDNLTLRLQTRLVDYTIDRRTGKVVSGDPKREKFMTYDWTMIRTLGTQTAALGLEQKDKAISFNCPHCGAPIDLTQSARCAYCDSIVKATEFDWVLSKIRGVAQRTV